MSDEAKVSDQSAARWTPGERDVLREAADAVRARPMATILIVMLGAACAFAAASVWIPPVQRAVATLVYHAASTRPTDGADGLARARMDAALATSPAVLARTRAVTESPDLLRQWRAFRRGGRTQASLDWLSDVADKPQHDNPASLAALSASIRTRVDANGSPPRLEIVVERAAGRDAAESQRLIGETTDVLADVVLHRIAERDADRVSQAAASALQPAERFRTERVEPAETKLRAFAERLESSTDHVLLERMLREAAPSAETFDRPDAASERARLDARLAELQRRRGALLNCIPAEGRAPKSMEALTGEQLAAQRPRIPREWLEAYPPLTEQVERIASLESRCEALAVRYTPANREVKDARDELTAARRRLLDELAATADAAGAEIVALAARRDQLNAEAQRDRTRAAAAARLLPEYQRLRNDVERARMQYEELRRAADDARTQAAAAAMAYSIQRLDDAAIVETQGLLRPSVVLLTALAAGLSLLLATMWGLALDRRSPWLRSAADGRRVGVPLLASIPHQSGGLLRRADART